MVLFDRSKTRGCLNLVEIKVVLSQQVDVIGCKLLDLSNEVVLFNKLSIKFEIM